MSKQKNVKLNKQTKIAFEILAIICLILLAIAITPKVFQNDTFYTIKIGQSIRQNGIDYKDHYSWHKDLKYLYPHWLYDVITSYIYDYCGGFQGLYSPSRILRNSTVLYKQKNNQESGNCILDINVPIIFYGKLYCSKSSKHHIPTICINYTTY